MAREWVNILPQDLIDLYRQAGFGSGKKRGFGQRPAVLAVDLQYAQVGDKPEPVLESVKKYPQSAGAEGWEALERIKELIETARRCTVPVIFTQIKRDPFDAKAKRWPSKIPPAKGPLPRKPDDLIEGIEPRPDEILITKKASSAFHGTNLMDYLVSMQVDALIIAGATTGSCVRSTALDASSHGYLPLVVEDCVFDRHPLRHAIHLFDLDSMNSDIVTLQEVKEYMEGLSAEQTSAEPASAAVAAGR
jgi:nicotinamidase-related amidase